MKTTPIATTPRARPTNTDGRSWAGKVKSSHIVSLAPLVYHTQSADKAIPAMSHDTHSILVVRPRHAYNDTSVSGNSLQFTACIATHAVYLIVAPAATFAFILLPTASRATLDTFITNNHTTPHHHHHSHHHHCHHHHCHQRILRDNPCSNKRSTPY